MGSATDPAAVGLLIGDIVSMVREAEQEEDDGNQPNYQGDAEEEKPRIDEHRSIKVIIIAG